MLGLGNSLNTSSPSRVISLAPPNNVNVIDYPDDEAIILSFQFSAAHPDIIAILDLFNDSSTSDYQDTNVTATATFERYDDVAGTTLQATSSGTLYVYKFDAPSGAFTGVLSTTDDGAFALSDFLTLDGAALINLSTFGGTDITSTNNGYYKATLSFDFGGDYDTYVIETPIVLFVEG